MLGHFFTKQFLMFLIVGGGAAVLHWLVRIYLSLWLPFSSAVIIAYGIGMLVAFILNSLFVFPHSIKDKWQQARDFILVNLLFLPLVWLSSMYIKLCFLSFGVNNQAESLAHAIAIALPALGTFLFYKLVAFKEKAYG